MTSAPPAQTTVATSNPSSPTQGTGGGVLVEKYGQVRLSTFLYVCIAFIDLIVSVEARATQDRK